jgi:hypothetical protein
VRGDGDGDGCDGSRRRLLAAGGALAPALAGTAGCLTRVRRTVSGPVVADAGSSHAHPASRPYLRDGLDERDAPGTWAVRLVTRRSEPPLLTPAAEPMAGFADEGFDGRWAVLVEYRTVREEAVSIGWRPASEGAWTGWREARTPLVAEAFDVDPPDVDGATELVVTARVWFESRPSPNRVRVPVYAADSERVLYEGVASAASRTP